MSGSGEATYGLLALALVGGLLWVVLLAVGLMIGQWRCEEIAPNSGGPQLWGVWQYALTCSTGEE